MSAHENLEHAEHAEHASHSNKKIALLISVLALFLAFSETLGKSAQTTAIADNIKTGTAREQQLDELIKLDTADGGSTGTKAFVYQDDLNAVREDIWGLRQASDAKHCPSVMAPAQ